ncbi:hypothetical protein M413DRAFT_446399 [Hebeloma cylindrosporum]|uniref:Uncharacterized protein n=1 Tax=Hebeloma cylindrosporum TaxID=76867 RepID=A0A0C3BU75_HEBCY|nr:hypothetical protein M413DRAFT_446399 [Hebeloma cylindrosporum h7]
MTPDTTERGKKRKRDVELPRITYAAASRTFDRLFKEDSLDGMKDVVRKKLGLSPSTPVHLAQIRDGKSVDLEDADDFEAFQSSAFSALTTKVQVVLGEGSTPTVDSQTEPISLSARRKKKKKRNSDALGADLSEAGPSDNTAKGALPSNNRKVAFAEASSDPSTTPYQHAKKNTQKEFRSDVHDASPDAVQPTKKAIPPSGRVSGGITLEGSEILSEKQKKKKPRKDKPAASASQNPELAPKPSDATETTQATDTQRTAVDEVAKPAKKSKKRKRAESPSRETSTESQKLPVLATSNPEAPSNNGDPEDSRARKKSKKKASNPLDETPPVLPEQSKPAPPNPTTQSSSQPVESSKSRKKEKAALNSVDKSVDPRPSEEPSNDKSDETKRPKKARRKSEAQPLEPPNENLSSTKTVQPSRQEHQSEDPGLPEPTKTKGKSKKTAEPPTRSSNESDPDVQSGSNKPSEKEVSPTAASSEGPAPPKTPKKTSKKKVEPPKAIDPSQPSQDDAPGEKSVVPQKTAVDVKEATRAAVQAILARKGVQSKATIQVTTTPAPPATIVPEELPSPSDNVGPAATQTTQVSEKSSQSKATKDQKTTEPAKCDVCQESPPHPPSKCPIIKAGIRSMRKRIAELQKDTSGGGDHSKVIAELQSQIEKKTKKPRASVVPKLDAPAPEGTSPPAANQVSDTPAQQSTSKQSSAQPLYSTQPLPLPPRLTSLPAPSAQLPTPQSPLVTRRSPSPQPPPSTQPRPKPTPQNTAKNSKRPSTVHLQALNLDDLSLGTTSLGFGDVSRYTEKDLEELVRGPKVSLADVPSSDPSEDENEQEEAAALESDSVEADLPRNLSQKVGYADSSDESDNEEDDERPGVSILREPPSIQSARLSSAPEASSATDDTQRGNRSFHEVEALDSSRELDRAGDIAVNDIMDADFALISPSKTSQKSNTGGDASSDTGKGPETRPTSPEIPLASRAVEKRQELDPIEPSENPQASQPELIVSDDEFPTSTPKEQVALRTRSQRNKAAAPASTPAATQNGTSQELVDEADEPSKPTRKTRSLTKISELPIPPNPAVRIIRPPLASTTVRTRRQMAQEESEEPEAPVPTPVKGKSTPAAKPAKPPSKAAAKATTRASKAVAREESEESEAPEPTPAKGKNPPAAKATKLAKSTANPPKTVALEGSQEPEAPEPTPAKGKNTPAAKNVKPPSKAAGRSTTKPAKTVTQEESEEPEAPEPTPAKGKNTPAAKTTSKPLSKAATKLITKPLMTPPPPKTVANKKIPVSAKSILANALQAGKTRGSKTAIVNASPPEDTGPNGTTLENSEHPVTSWVTLQESQASQETPGMLDELLSSPNLEPSLTKGQKDGVNGSSPVPLFVHAESQQSFPYSQYPDLSGKVPAASPNDSDDEDEVEAAVVKPFTKPPMFRRQSSQFANVTKPPPVIDYYGTSGRDEESEESDSDSDSEAEGKKAASHIPASRRAGVAVSKRK